MDAPLPLSAPEQFANIMRELCRAVVLRSLAGTEWAATLTLAWSRLLRLAGRFQALAAQIKAGTLPPPRVRKPRKRKASDANAGGQPDQKPPKPPRLHLPSSYGWLMVAVPQHAAGYGSQLRYLLTTDAEMKALLLATPRMVRLLRPLCQMLGIDADMNLPPIPGTAERLAKAPARLWEGGPVMGGWLARKMARGELKVFVRNLRPPAWARVQKPA